MSNGRGQHPLALLWAGFVLLLAGVAAGIAPAGPQGRCGSGLAPACPGGIYVGLAVVVWALIFAGACAIFIYFAFTDRASSSLDREPPPVEIGLELARLAYLCTQGVLTEDEFNAAKARLLGSDAAS